MSKGIACLEHDLTHYMKCGHCYEELEKENQKLREQLEEMRYEIPHIDKKVMDGKKEREKLKAALEHIGGMAGNPDAKEGCRLIVKKVNEVLK